MLPTLTAWLANELALLIALLNAELTALTILWPADVTALTALFQPLRIEFRIFCIAVDTDCLAFCHPVEMLVLTLFIELETGDAGNVAGKDGVIPITKSLPSRDIEVRYLLKEKDSHKFN